MPGHTVYTPLVAYLLAVAPVQRAGTLPCAAIAALLGAPLVLTARVTADHWGSSRTARRNWRAAGWTARRHRGTPSVTFTRPGT